MRGEGLAHSLTCCEVAYANIRPIWPINILLELFLCLLNVSFHEGLNQQLEKEISVYRLMTSGMASVTRSLALQQLEV